MMDFTVRKYAELIEALRNRGFSELILRHDVDRLPQNSLCTAHIEAERGIKGVYYFRAVPESWDDAVIRGVADLGHEVGYHYESLAVCDGDKVAAYDDFCRNLERLRQLLPVKKICMHGSPRSAYDNRDLWKKYDYRSLGIESEAYLDTDFSKTFYLTDTGRRWDGFKVSVRDKIAGWQDIWLARGWVFQSTDDVIAGLKARIIPDRLMLTVHPQRWNPFGLRWAEEFVGQKAKNLIKKMIIKTK